MRPGEKLYEELSTLLENTVASVEKIVFLSHGPGVRAGSMVDSLRDICEARPRTATLALKELS